MKLLLLVVALFIATTAQEQAPAIQWQKTLGGTADDEAASIQQTTDGGYIIAGWTQSNDSDVSGNHGSPNDYPEDYWIVKVNSIGTIEWQKTLGGYNDDWATCIQQTTDGGYIVVGNAFSSNGDVIGSHTPNYSFNTFTDVWVLKLSSTGVIQWQKCLGGTAKDGANSIQQTTDGGYIIAGYTSSNDGDVSGNHGNALNTDSWVVKINSTGTIQWQKCLGGSGNDEANSVQQTTDGGYIIAGLTASNDGDVSGNHNTNGYYDYWVVKLSNSGVLQWQKCLGGSGTDIAYSIQQTSDKGYIVAGTSPSNDGDVIGNNTISAYWIVKLDSIGSIKWQKPLGGSGGGIATSIQQTIDGGYIVAGYTSSNNGDVSGNHGNYDEWVIKLNNNGVLQWQKCLGGSSYDQAYCIQQTADKGYVVAGYTGSQNGDGDITGDRSLLSHYNFWIVKLAPDNIVPVKLISFTGYKENGANKLTWQTAAEINTDHFEIQRSKDGNKFENIGDKIAIGNSTILNNYIFTDNSPLNGVNYYRLKQVDNDGNFEYSKIIEITSDKNSHSIIYPNPASSIVTIIPSDKLKGIDVLDISGKAIQHWIPSSSNQYNLSSLSAGTYLLSLEYSDNVEIIKLNKE